MCRPKHVEELRSSGIINSTTRSHLVGSFYEIFITMHGSMNIKNTAELTRSAPGITRFVLFLCMSFHCQALYSLPDLDNSLCIQWEAECRIQERNDVGNVFVSALIERILLSNKGHEALNVYCVYIIQLFCYFIVHNLLNTLRTGDADLRF